MHRPLGFLGCTRMVTCSRSLSIQTPSSRNTQKNERKLPRSRQNGNKDDDPAPLWVLKQTRSFLKNLLERNQFILNSAAAISGSDGSSGGGGVVTAHKTVTRIANQQLQTLDTVLNRMDQTLQEEKAKQEEKEKDPTLEKLFARLDEYRLEKESLQTQLTEAKSHMEEARQHIKQEQIRIQQVQQRLSEAELALASERGERIQWEDTTRERIRIEETRRCQDEAYQRAQQEQRERIPEKTRDKMERLASERNTARRAVLRLQRRLVRDAKTNPFAQFTRTLTSVGKLTSSPPVTTTDFAQLKMEAIQLAQDAWRSHTVEQQHQQRGDTSSSVWRRVLSSWLFGWWSSVIPYSHWDARFRWMSSSSSLESLLPLEHWKLIPCDSHNLPKEALQQDSSNWFILHCESLSEHSLGAFGFLRALQQSGSLTNFLKDLHPFISPQLLQHEHRLSFIEKRSRSSGPGGQAANAAETHVSLTLSLDGEPILRSESQTSRSTRLNATAARSILLGERLDQLHRKLRKATLRTNGIPLRLKSDRKERRQDCSLLFEEHVESLCAELPKEDDWLKLIVKGVTNALAQ